MTGVYRPAVTEFEQVLRVPVFAPRLKATPIPDEDWDSGLIRCFHISDAWIPHILGALEVLDQPDTWLGTEAEIEAARQNVREIMIEIARGRECEPLNYVKFIGDCNEEGLLVTQIVGGVEGTARINISDCVPVPTTYVKSVASCDDGTIEFNVVVAGDETTDTIDLAACLAGEFLTAGDLPPTPEFEIVGNDLWVDTNGDGTNDQNLGRVVGNNGAVGATGADGITPTPSIIFGDLWFDTNNDGVEDINLGRVVGDDGVCEVCAPFPAPAVEADETNGLMCSIAINEAAYLRSLWDKAYNDTDGVLSGYVGGLVTGAGVLAYFFPGAAVAGALLGLTLTVLKGINDLESNAFDSDAEERYRCMLYCILQDAGSVNITEDIRSQWVAQIDADALNPFAAYVGDLLEYSPLDEFQWIAYASPEIDEAACAECDCDEFDPNCEVFDFTIDAQGWNPRLSGVSYVAGVGFRSAAGGSQDSVGITSPLRTRTVVSIEVEATSTASTNRLFVGVNTQGSQLDSGVSPYVMTGLNLVLTNDRVWITHDYAPGGSATHPTVITKVTLCYEPL